VRDDNEDKAALIDMYDEALDAFRKGDLESVLDHWEDDGAYLWPAVPPAIGKQEIRATYHEFFQHWTAEETFYRHELSVSGDLAFCRFGTELTLHPKSGGPTTRMTLQGTHIYRRSLKRWRCKIVIAINVPEA
jgi:ketosteroid isomerase-like protein